MTLYDNSQTVLGLFASTGMSTYFDMPDITEIVVNRPGEIGIETGKGWQFFDAPQLTFENLMKLSNAIVIFNNGKLTQTNAIHSVTLPGGERGQIVCPPVTMQNIVSITIRKPSSERFSLDDYTKSGRLTDRLNYVQHIGDLRPFEKEMLIHKKARDLKAFFELAVLHKLNIVLVGGTGSGKTTLTKALVDLIHPGVRLFTIENTHELNLPFHTNKVHLFYDDNNPNHTSKQIVASCMRMKPDRVFLTELRGDETWDYINLLNTGHPGSITTVHANDCLSAFSRLAALIKCSQVGQTLEMNYIMREVKTTIDVVAFLDHTYVTELYYEPETKLDLLKAA